MKNWRQTTIAQFRNNVQLITLLDALNTWIDPSLNFENFYNTVWNIDTAVGYGLDVLGRILVIPRSLTYAPSGFFGFGEPGDRDTFGFGPFQTAAPVVTETFTLSDPVYRTLLFAKAAFNITDCSYPAINAIMMYLFGGNGKNCYVTDQNATPPSLFGFGEPGDRTGFGQAPLGDFLTPTVPMMVMTYVFDFPMADWQKAIAQSGVLPKPVGVKTQWSFVD